MRLYIQAKEHELGKTMGMWEWIAIPAGIVLVVAVLVDVFFTVLHLDIDGPIAAVVHRFIAFVAVRCSRPLRQQRRQLLALVGPMLVVALFLSWMSLYILGFALIIWPFMESGFYSLDTLRPFTFIDALYYSGGAAAVLGFGDITPVSGHLKLLAVIESGLGFALITGVVAYLLSLLNFIAEREALALRLHTETACTGDGVNMVISCLKSEGVAGLASRLNSLAHSLYSLQAKGHQFPIIDLYYRSASPQYDPEPMLKALTDIAIASHLVSQTENGRTLVHASESFMRTVAHSLHLMADQYIGKQVLHRVERPQPQKDDIEYVTEVGQHLKQWICAGPPIDDQRGAFLAFQARVVQTELDRLTGWQMDEASHGCMLNPKGEQ